jgi:hypothetical protein
MTALPKRYSVSDDLRLPYDARIGPKLDVFLNGAFVTRCISFDVDAGKIERFQADGNGKILIERVAGEMEAKREILRGHVEVRWREKAGA